MEHQNDSEDETRTTTKAKVNLPLSHLAQTINGIAREIRPEITPEANGGAAKAMDGHIETNTIRKGASARRSNYLTFIIGRRDSSFLGPIPFTLARSSMDLKGPTSSL